MTDPEIQALEKLCEEATEGPWAEVCISGIFGADPNAAHIEATEADEKFASAAREAMPKLIADLKRAREALRLVKCVSSGQACEIVDQYFEEAQ